MQEPKDLRTGCDICGSHDNLSEFVLGKTLYQMCIKHRLQFEPAQVAAR